MMSLLKVLWVTQQHLDDEVQRSGAQDVEESIWERISGNFRQAIGIGTS